MKTMKKNKKTLEAIAARDAIFNAHVAARAAETCCRKIRMTTKKKKTSELFICQNCSWKGTQNEMKDYFYRHGRVQPGDVMPYGQCPECSCACFPVEKKQKPPKVVIYVKGGCVQDVKSNVPGLSVEVLDGDSMEEDPELLTGDGESPDVEEVFEAKTRGMKEVY